MDVYWDSASELSMLTFPVWIQQNITGYIIRECKVDVIVHVITCCYSICKHRERERTV